MPSRLPVVALVALLVVAGCLGGRAPTTDATTAAPTTDATTPPPADGTTTRHSPATRSCYYEGFEVDATPATPTRVAREIGTPVARLDYRPRRVVLAAQANGSATATVLGDQSLLDAGSVVYRNDTYYRVERTTVDTGIVVADGFELDGPLDPEYDADAYDAAERTAVAYDRLPAPDRRAFRAGLPRGRDLERLVSGGGSLAAGYRYAFRTHTARNASTLVEDGVHYVAFRDTYWRVASTGERHTTARMTRRYRLNRTADSAAAFGRRAVDRHAVGLNSGFDDAERDLLVRAFETGSVAWSDCGEAPPAGYEALLRAVDGVAPDGRLAYVRHRGTVYRVTVVHMIE